MNAQSTLVDCTLFMTTDSRMYDGLSISSMHTDAVVGADGGQALGRCEYGVWWLEVIAALKMSPEPRNAYTGLEKAERFILWMFPPNQTRGLLA